MLRVFFYGLNLLIHKFLDILNQINTNHTTQHQLIKSTYSSITHHIDYPAKINQIDLTINNTSY